MKTTDDIIDELRLAATSDPAPAGLSGLLTEAADRLDNLFASGIHTCHADCQRPMCVLRRERDKAQADLARVTHERKDYWRERLVADGVLVPAEQLASVTAERQNWKEWAEEARAMFHKQIDAAAVMKTRAEQAEQRNAELVADLKRIQDAPGSDQNAPYRLRGIARAALARHRANQEGSK